MKKVEAVIRPDKVEAVKSALQRMGHNGLTVLSARGHGAQGGVKQKWRLKEYVVDLLPKALVVVVVEDGRLEATLDAITEAARTGAIGDGKVFISDVADALRIRTGERGASALRLDEQVP